MKRAMYLLLTALFLAVASQTAWAGTINVSTGLDASNNLISVSGQADAHWILPGGTAQVITPSSPDWWGNYIANGPNSDWLSNNAAGSYNGPAPYSFNLQFDLSGYDLSTVSLSGSWAIADGGTLSLNGNQIDSLAGASSPNSPNWSSLHSFSVAVGSPWFNPGLNTLTLTVTASDDYYEAVRLEGLVTGTSVSPVPEPCTLLLMGSGVLGLAGLLRRGLLGY